MKQFFIKQIVTHKGSFKCLKTYLQRNTGAMLGNIVDIIGHKLGELKSVWILIRPVDKLWCAKNFKD